MAPPLSTSTRVGSRTSSKLVVAVALFAGAAALALFALSQAKYHVSLTNPVPNNIPKGHLAINDSFVQVASSDMITCALTATGKVWCWGDNSYGQLGVSPQQLINSADPVLITQGTAVFDGVASISVNNASVCAIKNDKTVWCWGAWANQTNNLASFAPIKQMMTASQPITDVATFNIGWLFCFTKTDGSAWCYNNSALGNGQNVYSNYPVRVVDENMAPTTNIGQVYSAYPAACIVKNDLLKTPLCWGGNETNQLGDGTTLAHNTPNFVMDAQNRPLHFYGTTKIADGGYHMCAIDPFGSVVCWGECNNNNIFNDRIWKFLVPPPTNCSDGAYYFPNGNGKAFRNVVDITAGQLSTCARKSDGTVWCWGWNIWGQLGDGTANDSWKSPVQVKTLDNNQQPIALTGAAALSSGPTEGSCVILNNNKIMCWGTNNYHRVGNGCNVSFCRYASVVTFP